MDRRVGWSPEALDDVEAIAEYIARDSSAYAAAVVHRIIEASRKLAAFPEIGRIVPELGDESVRELFVYSYRLIYRIKTDTVLVVAAVHGKRLLDIQTGLDPQHDHSRPA
ncbi:MAG: type II toxin-antitoxin system RelE/ParE family toxin [Gammaproteobacteria bacterium]|nr:type II toxin-antitoxin system RelE/ParE family toxin [Gammaproteobacteria bacterium]